MSKLKVWFLNVGQGDSTYLEFEDSQGEIWRGLIDCNLDAQRKGINVIEFLADRIPLQEENGEKFRYLDYLIVTHPHADHIRGIADIGEQYRFGELWDSGHVPEEENNSELYEKYAGVKEKHKDVLHQDDRKMSRAPVAMCGGELLAHIFSPSRFITCEEEMTGQERREAIHSECMAFKLIFGDFSILFAGDSNWLAWERITNYEYYDDDTLKAAVLHASHHGSRTFFRKDQDQEPLRAGIERIDPDHLVVSVPADSPHDHPHDDAMETYREHVPEDEIYYTHDKTVILEADEEGDYSLDHEDGDIQEKYELSSGSDEDDKGGGGGRAQKAFSVTTVSRSRLDDQGSA